MLYWFGRSKKHKEGGDEQEDSEEDGKEINADQFDSSNPALLELNKRQREAVLNENKRVLILAGAGSGKTKTLIQKVLYLISEKNVDPRNILAITFTKNAANEMLDRLILTSDTNGNYKKILHDKKLTKNEKDKKRTEYIKKYPWLSNISVKTFHGFCNQILRRRGGEEFDNKFKILMDKRYDAEIGSGQVAREIPEEIINKKIIELCENTDYLLKLKRYILDYYVDAFNLKMQKKGIHLYEKPYTSLKGDRVCSKSERDIADWLYRHNISYTYEPLAAPGTFEMQPDFFIDEANLYLEHISNKSYPLADKEKEMEEAGENYLKIFEHAMHDSGKFNAMMDKIVFSRIDKELKGISPLDFAEEFKGYEKYRRYFVLDILRMIDKIKVENRKFNSVYISAQKDQHERVRDFYELGKPIFESYQNYCIDHSYLDFNDLLIRTVSFLNNNSSAKNAYRNRFKYILVDEFQDVNTVQVKLLKHFLTDENQLFCVGDDWQSIYGFRGSNVEYIVNFERFFPGSTTIKLNLNYRSNDTIVNASNEVIKNNKFKIEKEISSFNKESKKIYLYCAKIESEDGVDTVIENVDNLLKKGYDKEDILVLTRTRKAESFERYYEELQKRRIKITTIHQAKGLEAKFVFIIGLTRGFMGFPNVRDEDRIFQVIKKSDYELSLEEERRLFYVALTRAKDELFLISEVGNESEFISEIPGEFLDRTNFLILNLKRDVIKNCIFCKREIQEDFDYCPYCGNKLKSDGNEDKNLKKSSDLDEIRKTYPNAYMPWKKEDDITLKEGFTNGKTIDELASMFQRKVSAIHSRLIKLGLISDEEKENNYKKPESKNENEISINQDKTMDDDFYNDLKKWRLEKAKEEKIPLYCIFHNKTLNEIAEKMPENFIELLKINGIGQVNIERYGKEIIDLVKINMKKSSIETEGKKRIRI
jgi:DNA helicase-4